MKYCSECSHPVRLIIPQGEDRERHVCSQCGTIHYQNPKVIAGFLPVWGQQVLLCKRAIEPRLGFWTLPAGFMELGETLEDAARREAFEEANAQVGLGDLYTVFSLPHLSQVYAFFRGDLLNLDFSAGSESLEVGLFHESEIPWKELAFETVRQSLSFFFEDRKSGHFPNRVINLAASARIFERSTPEDRLNNQAL